MKDILSIIIVIISVYSLFCYIENKQKLYKDDEIKTFKKGDHIYVYELGFHNTLHSATVVENDTLHKVITVIVGKIYEVELYNHIKAKRYSELP